MCAVQPPPSARVPPRFSPRVAALLALLLMVDYLLYISNMNGE